MEDFFSKIGFKKKWLLDPDLKDWTGLVDKIWGRNDGLAKSDIRVFDPYLKRQSIDPKNQKYDQIDPKI